MNTLTANGTGGGEPTKFSYVGPMYPSVQEIVITITKHMEKQKQMQISNIVKTLMKENNLTLTELSSMSGVATSTLSDLLNNKHTPTLKTIKRVLRALI